LLDIKLRFIFKFFDEHDNDYITPRMIIDCLRQNEIKVDEAEVLKIFDGDKSKKLGYEEFKKLMIDDDSTNSAKSTITN
jgi:Ca2+-binding EF-hand superfamily protein